MSGKNRGVTLFFSRFGGETPIPPEFIAAMDRKEERTSVPNDVTAEALSDTIIESEVKTDRDNERSLITVKKKPGNIVLRAINTNDSGQPVQVTRTLFPTGTTPAPPSATDTVAVHDLGNGWSIQEVAVEGAYDGGGNFVPGIFSGNKFDRERPNLVPVEFRPSIPTVTSRTDSAGTAVDPTLSGTELHESQEQLTQFKKRIEITTQAAPSLPVVLDKGRDTNTDKQSVTVTRTLATDATSAPAPSATKDVKIDQLGDGNKVIEEREVQSLAAHQVYAKEQPDLTPEKFRPAIQSATTRTDSAGTVSNPTLGANELVQRQEQITELTKRIESTSRAKPSLPVVIDQGVETNTVKQIVSVTETLMTNVTSSASPSALQDVQVEDLGDGRKVETKKAVGELFGAEALRQARIQYVPQEFLFGIPEVTTSLDTVATTPTVDALGSTELVKDSKRINEFVVRTESTTQADPSLPVTLDKGRDTNQDQQDVTVIRKLLADGTAAETSTAIKDVSVKQLGDGRKVQETRAVPSVATHNVFSRERPNLVPEKFRPAIPTVTTRADSAGTAVDPTLSGTELVETQEQITEQKKRISVSTQALPGTVALSSGIETNAERQRVAVTETFQPAATTPTVPTSRIEVENRPTGDGNAVEIVKTRPSVPAHNVFTAELVDTVPPEFRASAQETIVEATQENATASAPTLSGQDFQKVVEQVDVFNTRTRTRTHGTENTSLTDKELDGISARGSLFNSFVSRIRTLASGAQSIQQGFLFIRSKVKDLGNGKSLRETDAIDAFPTLVEETVDPETGVKIVRTKTIVAAGTANPGGFTNMFPLDKARTLQETDAPSAATFDAYSMIFEGTTNVDLPTQLVSITPYFDAAGQAGNYGENGTYTLAGQGNGGISLHGTAQGAGAISPDVDYQVVQFWGSNIPCRHFLFLVASNVARSTILAKLTSLNGGSTVNPWPKFTPKSVSMICHSERVGASAQVGASASDSYHTDYAGGTVHTGSIRTQGQGYSFDVTLNTKIIRIPPTIHNVISGYTTSGSTLAAAACTISNGATGSNQTVSVNANGTINPTFIPSTGNSTSVPSSGFYLHQLFAEPYKNGYVKMHAVVVNMADIV